MKKGYSKLAGKKSVATKKSDSSLKRAYALDSPIEMPTLHLNEKNLPAIKDWKIGDKHKIELEVELTSLSKDTYGDNKDGLHACFKITNTANSAQVDEDDEED